MATAATLDTQRPQAPRPPQANGSPSKLEGRVYCTTENAFLLSSIVTTASGVALIFFASFSFGATLILVGATFQVGAMLVERLESNHQSKIQQLSHRPANAPAGQQAVRALRTAQRHLRETERERDTQAQRFLTDIAQLNQQIRTLLEQIRQQPAAAPAATPQAQRNLTDLEQRLATATRELADRERRLQEVQRALQTQQTTNGTQADQLRDVRQRNAQLLGGAQTRQQAEQALQAQITDLTQAVATAAARERMAAHQTLQACIAELGRQHTQALATQEQQLNQQAAEALQARVAELGRQHTQALATQEQQLNQQAAEALQARVAELGQQHTLALATQAQQLNEQAEATLQAHEGALGREHTQALAAQTQRTDTATAEVARLNARVGELERAIATRPATAVADSQAQRDLETLRSELVQARATLATQLKQQSTAAASLESLQTQLRTATTEHQRLQSETQAEIHRLQAELQRTQTEATDAQAGIRSQLEAQIQALRETADSATQLHTELENARTRIAALEAASAPAAAERPAGLPPSEPSMRNLTPDAGLVQEVARVQGELTALQSKLETYRKYFADVNRLNDLAEAAPERAELLKSVQTQAGILGLIFVPRRAAGPANRRLPSVRRGKAVVGMATVVAAASPGTTPPSLTALRQEPQLAAPATSPPGSPRVAGAPTTAATAGPPDPGATYGVNAGALAKVQLRSAAGRAAGAPGSDAKKKK